MNHLKTLNEHDGDERWRLLEVENEFLTSPNLKCNHKDVFCFEGGNEKLTESVDIGFNFN